MSERDFQRMIIQLASLLGYAVYHDYDSRRSTPGFPDLCLLRATPARYLMVELKSDRGRVSTAQQAWLDGLQRAGIEVHVWRPRDWDLILATLQA